MKKNNMLRIASVLLVAVLLSTCAISGAFAKYITTGDPATDTASIANWGVTISATGAAFKNSEDSTTIDFAPEDDDSMGFTVKSTGKVIAPGMSGTLAAINIQGTPEVAVNVAYVATLELSGWGTYCPVYFTIGNETYGVAGIKDADGEALDHESADITALKTDVKNAIQAFSANYEAGTDLSTAAQADIQWAWAFEGNNDTKDTALAGIQNAITLTITTTVTQID